MKKASLLDQQLSNGYDYAGNPGGPLSRGLNFCLPFP
jgi:hypothetical protein